MTSAPLYLMTGGLPLVRSKKPDVMASRKYGRTVGTVVPKWSAAWCRNSSSGIGDSSSRRFWTASVEGLVYGVRVAGPSSSCE